MCLYIVILCCMLFMEQKHFQLSQHLLLDQSPYSGLMKLRCLCLAPYINIISINDDLMCAIEF